MEILDLNTKDDQDKGAFCHLRHTKFDHLMYTGEGSDELGRLVDETLPHEKVGAWVKGYESDKIQKLINSLQAKRLANPKEMTNELLGTKVACALVIKFSGLTLDGQPLEATEENKIKFFKQSDSLVKQVNEFAKLRANFFEEPPLD